MKISIINTVVTVFSSLAMETRNTIFRDSLLYLQKMYPHIEESYLVKAINEKIPSHFDAFGAKKSESHLEKYRMAVDMNDRALDKACHGFPLHLPGHVEPCRDEEKVKCNESDQKIRR